MVFRVFETAAAIVAAAVLSTSSAFAGDCATKTDWDANKYPENIIACLVELESENAKLSDEIAALKSTNNITSLPTGAVVAFDLPSGCPEGWSLFDEAVSRTIVGAYQDNGAGVIQVPTEDMSGKKLMARHYRAWGGEEKHALTIGEMPAHTHGAQKVLITSPGSGGLNILIEAGQTTHANVLHPSDVAVSSIGGGEAHNTMPPYIALFYCRKD